jgi:hypothetical protein
LNNFVIEAASACKSAASRSKSRNPGTGPFPGNWKGHLMGILRGLAGFNLLYQFAIRPTLSDVKNILERIERLDDHISSLIKEGDRVQTRHHAHPVPDRIVLPGDYVFQDVILFGDYPGWKTYVETRWVNRCTYHATMRFRYDTSKLRGLLGSLRSRLNAFGISDILPTIWEAIPYSFVIDWFVNVGDMLRSLEDHLVGDLMPIQILDFVHSIKYKYTTRTYHDCGKKPYAILSRILLYEQEVTYYARRHEAPCLVDALSIRTPSVNQTLLGGSLLIMRM